MLAFPNVQEAGRLALPEASDLAAVVGALRCVSEERWEQAQELLRPVPRGSLFAAWKILVKGMIAFYTGDPEKAGPSLRNCRLTAYRRGLLTRFGCFSARIIAEIRRTRDRTGGKRRMLSAQCDRPGAVSAACGPVLASSTTCGFLQRDASSSRLPLGTAGSGRRAIRFLFQGPFRMPDAAHDKYRHWFDRLAGSGRFKNDLEARLTYRLLGCAELDNPFSGEIEHFWRMFLQYFPEDNPLSAKIASLGLERVGAHYAQREEADPFFFDEEGERLRDAEGAIRLLKESIECDPSNLDAYLKLLDVYEWAGQDNDRDRLLDRMAELFPKDKAVLIHAGRESLKRKVTLRGFNTWNAPIHSTRSTRRCWKHLSRRMCARVDSIT